MRAVLSVGVLTAVVACAGTDEPTGNGTPGPASSPSPAPVDRAETRAILDLLDALNATAGGPVEEQRARIERLLDPGQVRAQQSCAPATTTLSFEPLPERARPRPGWTPPSGEIDGMPWGVPVLMRIHDGDRVVGTDLTELHVVIGPDGTARLPAMCVN